MKYGLKVCVIVEIAQKTFHTTSLTKTNDCYMAPYSLGHAEKCYMLIL